MGRAANFGVHVVHYAFFNRLDFVFTQETRRSISQQYEVAFTVGTYRPVDVAAAVIRAAMADGVLHARQAAEAVGIITREI